MKVKVCGLKYPQNISELESLAIDFSGYIFYPKSKRNIDYKTLIYLNSTKPSKIKRVGVFVDEPIKTIKSIAQLFDFSYIQLHGEETPMFCKLLNKEGYNIIKAFSISNKLNFSILKSYEPFCSYFLFDTKGTNKGGNGIKFNWEILTSYKLKTPFFLSGGIEPTDAKNIKNLGIKQLAGVDINSGFEKSPGYKNVSRVKSFLKTINAK